MTADAIERASWLKARQRGIGGSDAAAVLGLSRYRSPLQVWAEKTGMMPEPADEDLPEHIFWGRALEPVVVGRYETVTKRQTRASGDAICTSKDYPFMLGTIDRYVDPCDGHEGPGILEAKTTGVFLSRDWDEEPPLEAQVQAQHYLAVTGLAWCSIVALIGGQRLRWQDIPRNEPFIAVMIEREAEFWLRVERREPPRVVNGIDNDFLKRLFPRDSGEVITLPVEALDLDVRRCDAKKRIKELEEEVEDIDARLREMIGAATDGLLPDGSGKYRCKSFRKDAFTVEAHEERPLRRLKL